MQELDPHGIRRKRGPVLGRGTQAKIIVARKQALGPFLATRNVQAHLRSGMAQAKGGDEARGKTPRAGSGSDPQHIGPRRAQRGEPLFGALEETDQLLARPLQLAARRSRLQPSSPLLEEREAE